MIDAADPCRLPPILLRAAAAARAATRRVTVVDRAKSTVPVELNVSAADVAGERERVKALADAKQRKQTDAEDEEDEWDEWGKKPKELVEAKRKQRRRSLQSDSQRLMGLGFEKSAREKLWAEEQKVIASNHARNERVARAEAKEQAEKMASLLDAKAPWTCDVCQKSMPRSKVSSCTFISLSSAVSVSLPLSLCHCVFLN
jgi:hypothetical protein|eukprot:COSAG06_NODE_6917_length_2717_cov_4.660511_3_plen_201_part_00